MSIEGESIVPETNLSGARLAVFSATIAAAVGLGTFPSFAFGVLAPFLRDDFDLSRSELGLLTTAFFLVGAPASMFAGRLVDRVGGRILLAAMFAVAAGTTLGIAAAPSYPWLVAMSAVAGVPLALGNPITNKLVARNVSSGSRGIVMGVKQSGVQIGAFLAGAVLPRAARAWGWRMAVALGIGICALGIIGALLAPRTAPDLLPDEARPSLRMPGLKALAWYAFLMGWGMAAVGAYLPLYGVESIGMSATTAGGVASTIGLMGVCSRIVWGWRSGRFTHMSLPLMIMSSGAALATGLILVGQSVGGWIMWPAAVMIGATGAAWMAVAMLSILSEVEHHQTGRASGFVVFGFLGGCIASPMVFGYLVDVTGSYVPGWLGVMTAFMFASVIVLHWRRTWRLSMV